MRGNNRRNGKYGEDRAIDDSETGHDRAIPDRENRVPLRKRRESAQDPADGAVGIALAVSTAIRNAHGQGEKNFVTGAERKGQRSKSAENVAKGGSHKGHTSPERDTKLADGPIR